MCNHPIQISSLVEQLQRMHPGYGPQILAMDFTPNGVVVRAAMHEMKRVATEIRVAFFKLDEGYKLDWSMLA